MCIRDSWKNREALQSSKGHYRAMNLNTITSDKLVAMYERREVSVTEVISGVFDHIEKTDKDVRAFLTLCRDTAMEDARQVDGRIAAGERLQPLSGVPVAIKDNMTMRDVPTTCGSKILDGYIPPYTATAVERLRDAGAIVVGKTCLLYTSDAADERSSVDLGGR